MTTRRDFMKGSLFTLGALWGAGLLKPSALAIGKLDCDVYFNGLLLCEGFDYMQEGGGIRFNSCYRIQPGDLINMTIRTENGDLEIEELRQSGSYKAVRNKHG